MLKYLYVAGPISGSGVVQHNVTMAVKACDALMSAGFVPFCPHLSVLHDMIAPRDYESWLTYDLAWVERVDALIRLPGASSGADREVAHAQAHGKPVFFGVEEFLSTRPPA